MDVMPLHIIEFDAYRNDYPLEKHWDLDVSER